MLLISISLSHGGKVNGVKYTYDETFKLEKLCIPYVINCAGRICLIQKIEILSIGVYESSL